MKTIRLVMLLMVALLAGTVSAAGVKNLKGKKLDFVCADAQFKNPFIDVDKTMTEPVKCRYIHGGFDDGTRFSFYFPLNKEDFTGRFFQYITPMPDSETSAQNYYAASPIGFSISHGAYFIETNEGGALDVNNESTRREATIGAYRANAAWCMDGSGEFTQPVDLSKAQFSANGEHVEFDTTVSYNQPGTYFPTVKVFSERKGDAQTPYTCIPNLGKVRIVVK